MISYHIISYYIIFTYKLYYNGMIFDPMTDPGWSYTMVYLALWKNMSSSGIFWTTEWKVIKFMFQTTNQLWYGDTVFSLTFGFLFFCCRLYPLLSIPIIPNNCPHNPRWSYEIQLVIQWSNMVIQLVQWLIQFMTDPMRIPHHPGRCLARNRTSIFFFRMFMDFQKAWLITPEGKPNFSTVTLW